MDDCCDLGALLHADGQERFRRAAVEGFWAIWRGESPVAAALFHGDSPAELLSQLVDGGRIELGHQGWLRGIHGLTLETTAHQIHHADGHVHTWCAFVAVGIPAALGIDAMATT